MDLDITRRDLGLIRRALRIAREQTQIVYSENTNKAIIELGESTASHLIKQSKLIEDLDGFETLEAKFDSYIRSKI